jgi:hypothetical protein
MDAENIKRTPKIPNTTSVNDMVIMATLGKIQNETSHLRLGFRSEIPNFHPLTFATFHLSILSVWRH